MKILSGIKRQWLKTVSYTHLDVYKRQRVDCAGQGDFIVCLYNPKSKKRADYVEKAAEILMKYRDGKTPVGIVRPVS